MNKSRINVLFLLFCMGDCSLKFLVSRAAPRPYGLDSIGKVGESWFWTCFGLGTNLGTFTLYRSFTLLRTKYFLQGCVLTRIFGSERCSYLVGTRDRRPRQKIFIIGGDIQNTNWGTFTLYIAERCTFWAYIQWDFLQGHRPTKIYCLRS